jgi:hypothetical protein
MNRTAASGKRVCHRFLLGWLSHQGKMRNCGGQYLCQLCKQTSFPNLLRILRGTGSRIAGFARFAHRPSAS